MLAGGNAYLHPKQYPAAGARIAAFARDAAAAGVALQFDCGFVRCMFADEDLEMLLRPAAISRPAAARSWTSTWRAWPATASR